MSKNRKIKVLRIINRFNIGGPIYNAVLLSAFMPEEYETLLIGGMPEENEANSLYIAEKYGVSPVLISEMQREPNLINDNKALKKIKEIIRTFQPDIVHTHASKAGALGRKAAFDCGVPIVIHTFHGHIFHSYFSWWKTSLYQLIERRLSKKTTGIIAISAIQKNELSLKYKICHPSKIQLIPLGFDLSPFNENLKEKRELTRNSYALEESDIAVAIIGRLVAIKNHQMFLDIIDKVNQKTSKKVVYFIVGDGEESLTIQESIKPLKEKGMDIRMTSWIKDIATFNAGMDIICLTSKNEGTPVSLIEAQATGIPIIATNVGGIKDIILEDKTGYIVDKDDIDGFSEKLWELIENENKRQLMSQNGWSFVEEKFQYPNLIKNMDEYYKSLLKEMEIWP
ncbi:MAG: glycosyltransferase [Crocinitomicaceae bacterium]|nr:glycosyltransferase [Crocinitomicaceae bacterium]